MRQNIAWRGYLLTLHVVVLLAILRTAPAVSLATNLGIEHPTVARNIAKSHALHLQTDAHVPSGAVVVLGDSQALKLPAAAIAPNSVNFAISGLRSDHLLTHMGEYRSLSTARAVIVMVGTNDVLYGREEGIEQRYRAILWKIPASIPVILVGPPPLRQEVEAARRASDSARSACAASPKCTFVDAFHILDAPGSFEDDDAHLSEHGYRLLIEALRQTPVPYQSNSHA